MKSKVTLWEHDIKNPKKTVERNIGEKNVTITGGEIVIEEKQIILEEMLHSLKGSKRD